MFSQSLLRSGLLASTLLTTLTFAAPVADTTSSSAALPSASASVVVEPKPYIPEVKIYRNSGNSTADHLARRDNGEVNWVNFCSETIYFLIAGPGFQIGPYTLNYGDYSVNQQPPTSGAGAGTVSGGYSAKFSKSKTDFSSVYQLEYSQDGTYVWYDFSAQNGDPFVNEGSSIWPSGGDYGSAPQDCQHVNCPPGDDSQCSYQGNNAAGPVHHCTVDTTINAYMCPDNQH